MSLGAILGIFCLLKSTYPKCQEEFLEHFIKINIKMNEWVNKKNKWVNDYCYSIICVSRGTP